MPKPYAAPEVIYCNDHTAHKPGSKPYILGGTCCCTPADGLMKQLQADGFCQGMTATDLAGLYQLQSIRLRDDKDHQRCSGLCKAGPHVVLGGKCLCPPTPGTLYYEKVVFGQGAVANPFDATGKPIVASKKGRK